MVVRSGQRIEPPAQRNERLGRHRAMGRAWPLLSSLEGPVDRRAADAELTGR